MTEDRLYAGLLLTQAAILLLTLGILAGLVVGAATALLTWFWR